MIEKGNVTLVDVRNKESYHEGHIEGAHHIDESNIESFVKNADKSKPLICYCYLGNSSKQAAAYFNEQGFSEVFSVMGGYMSWPSEL